MIALLFVQSLNKILQSNQSSRNLLARHAGSAFCLNIANFTMTASISESGYLANCSQLPDVTIAIPISCSSYLIDKDQLKALQQIDFTGDVELGHNILEIISNLNFEGIFLTDKPTLNLATNILISIFTQIQAQAKLILRNSGNSLSEYLLYESADIVTKYELDQFYTEVDQIQDQSNRLEAKLNLILGADGQL